MFNDFLGFGAYLTGVNSEYCAQQKVINQFFCLWNRGSLKVINNTKLIINETDMVVLFYISYSTKKYLTLLLFSYVLFTFSQNGQKPKIIKPSLVSMYLVLVQNPLSMRKIERKTTFPDFRGLFLSTVF